VSGLIEVRGLRAGYVKDVEILRGVDLTLNQGELATVVGPNGAGKSTLIKAIFGLLKPSAGTVTLRGEDVTGLKPHSMVARGVGYVPQVRNVFPALTVEENLDLGAYLKPKLRAERKEMLYEWFPLLAERRRSKAGKLSGGQRQLVAIARALMPDPAVLLLDEPSAGLSPANVDEIFHRIEEIYRRGVSLIMVEQNARRALAPADVGYVLDQGTNAYTGVGVDLIHDPKVAQLYLGGT
jgi:branched-chain amino acid transport system ATP-binding protein